MTNGDASLLGAVACLLLAGLTACVPPKPTREEIVGLWVERGVPASTSPSDGGSFEFFRDGRFEARNVPREYFISKGTSPTRISTSGSWELDTSSKDPLVFHRVNLKFDPLQGYPLGFGSYLLISADEHGSVLFAWMGDESNRVTFIKKKTRDTD
jgi:hypothetical protein